MGRRFGSGSASHDADAALAVAGSGRMTRKQVADRLGVAETSVRRLEGTYLHTIRHGRFVFFDQAEVEHYAAEGGRRQRHDSGEVAARAFELFREGKDFRDVVIELRQTPEKIRQLLREYALSTDLYVPAAIRCEIEQMGYFPDGHRLTAQDILSLIQGLGQRNESLVRRSIDQDNAMDRLRRALARAQSSSAQPANATPPSPTMSDAPPPVVHPPEKSDDKSKDAESATPQETLDPKNPSQGTGTHGP
jgi:hypothetical protein